MELSLSQRVLAAVFVTMIVVSAAGAQQVELTPQIGYRWGGGLTDYYTGEDFDFNNSESYGITFNYTVGLMGDTQFEFSWNRQDTAMDVSGYDNDSFDLKIDYWQIGGLKQWNEDEPLRPFVIGSLGATHFSPDLDELSSATRFSIGVGGGVKILPGDHIGVRLQGKIYGTYASGNAGMICGTQGCTFGFAGNFMWQAEVSAGLIFGFGDK